MLAKKISRCLFVFVVLFFPFSTFSETLYVSDLCATNSDFNIGSGIYDITGPAAEEGMMGYAMFAQKTAGIFQRLWARAFVIESPCNGKRIAFVNTDLGMVFLGVKQAVVERLREKLGDLYTDDNVLLTATHTHSGPGGFSQYLFYDVTTLGFDRKHFDVIVDGIVSAIMLAEANKTPAHIKLARGELSGVGFNRSPTSYIENPLLERERYTSNTDTKMTLIRFDDVNGVALGLINWFPVHGTSLNNKNLLISGDNKGYAEYLFERDMNTDAREKPFVAAFSQANAGDVSPNYFGHEGGVGMLGRKAVHDAAWPQYIKAKDLFSHAKNSVTGGIDYRHTFVRMDKIRVQPEYADGEWRSTCPAAIGMSMFAGTQDGEGYTEQGITCEVLSKKASSLACALTTTPCQGDKPIVFQLEGLYPTSWVPQILPLQIVKIGRLVVVAVPFELTTMAGRRIRESVQTVLPAGYTVVISALSNAYEHYVTTPEEYQLQRYEGASNHFGPWTLPALQQEYVKLAESLMSGSVVPHGPTPPDLIDEQTNLQTGVAFDDVPLGKHFGDIHQDVRSHYQRTDSVVAVFWGAHPKNNYRIADTFLEVQQMINGQWVRIRTDNDFDTEFHWRRLGVAWSLVTLVWHIPTDQSSGQYRLVYHGDWKNILSKISPYQGVSSNFTI